MNIPATSRERRFSSSGPGATWRHRSAALAVALAAGLAAPSLLDLRAHAAERGKTADGAPYMSGGVSESEQLELQGRRLGYSLWVVTAVAKTGAYLADARIRIWNEQRHLVFAGWIDGPWLFIDLPLGRYEVEAVWQGQVVRRTTTIHAGDRRQIVAYFEDADADEVPRGAAPGGR